MQTAHILSTCKIKIYLHNFAMLKVLFVLSFVIFSCAQLRTRCGDGTATNLTFTPANDSVAGRYIAELCTNLSKNVTKWKLDVMLQEKGVCYQTAKRRHPGVQHSEFSADVNVTTLNCSYVCMSTNLDLIFNGCYLLKSIFESGRVGSKPYDSYHRIVNQFTKANITAKPQFIANNHDSGVALHLIPGVPLIEYSVHLYDNNSNELEVTNNCTNTSSMELYCYLSSPYGCYNLEIKFYAPWASGMFLDKHIIDSSFCHQQAAIPEISGNNWSVVWLCGVVLAVSAGACLASLAWRTRTVGKIREQVRKTWVEHRTDTEAALQQNKGSCKHILLLYARECEAGQRAVALLRQLLAQVVPGHVYDIFSAEVMSLAASAPAQWIREVIEQSDVRVVLLQTPALACLYRANLDDADSTFRLQEPLLGSRVVQRSPHFGDTLLHYALRLMTETAHHHDAYTKYYLAQLSELKVEIFPQIVRFTRYPLPGATSLLLRDISSPAAWDPPDEAVADYTRAIADFVEYASGNPNYLMDEIMFV